MKLRTIDDLWSDYLGAVGDLRERGATWTYLTTDEPFGSMTARVMRGLVSMFKKGIKG